MNETLNVLETRRSVRAFDPSRMPTDQLISEVVKAGEYAPTGRGMQSPRIVVITNKAVRDRLSAAAGYTAHARCSLRKRASSSSHNGASQAIMKALAMWRSAMRLTSRHRQSHEKPITPCG